MTRRYLRSPWYWVLVALALVLVMFVGGLVGVTVGVNPYIAMMVAGGLFVLYETYQTARHPQ